MNKYYRNMIDLLKQQISSGKVNDNEVSALLLALGKEIDRCKVYNKPNAELESLYEDALWLKYYI
jgi:hypothetical protein